MQTVIDLGAEVKPLFLGRRFVELGQFAKNFGRVDALEAPVSSGFHAGQLQHCGEHVEQAIRFIERSAQRFAIGL